ncbi:MAG: nucleotidyltransferase domain-containing protein [Bacteroidota bacterium]
MERKKVLNKISNYFAHQPIDRAWIFGSYSREEESKKSDIDILVKFSPKVRITLLKYIHLMNELSMITGRKIDLVEEGQLKHFAVKNADADKILIYERKAKR